ncbi:MAG TPA: hypothetical protein VL362_03275 [Patescibacteria group bacterium]|nr:hypothetical protein [Patescibacteria group bacterium]
MSRRTAHIRMFDAAHAAAQITSAIQWMMMEHPEFRVKQRVLDGERVHITTSGSETWRAALQKRCFDVGQLATVELTVSLATSSFVYPAEVELELADDGIGINAYICLRKNALRM